MRLADDPEAEVRAACGPAGESMLFFTCPADGCQLGVRFSREGSAKGVKPIVWKATGEFPDTLTLAPSVHVFHGKVSHWHGYIRDGAAVTC